MSPALRVLAQRKEGHHQLTIFHYTYHKILNMCCFIPLRNEVGMPTSVEPEAESVGHSEPEEELLKQSF